jgi:hypothetical protein
MLNYNDLNSNVNITNYNITEEDYKLERLGYCNYIIEIANSLSLQIEICKMAIYYLNCFYVKHSFLCYDKRLMCCASLLLACKMEDKKIFINDIVRAHLNSKTSLSLFKSNNSVDQEVIKDSINQVCFCELKLLQTIGFNVKLTLPIEYVYFYTTFLYPERENELNALAFHIEKDSFYTLVNNVFPPFVVALACIFIGCKLLKLPCFTSTDFDKFGVLCDFYLEILNSNSNSSSYYNRDKDKTEIFKNPSEVVEYEYFNIKLLEFDGFLNKKSDVKFMKYDKTWYESLTWNKKLHPFLEANDFFASVKMIVDYYDDIQKLNSIQ